MYQSEFFQINSNAQVSEFKPAVISVYKILADNSYFHYCDDEEKTKYQEGAYAFIFCTDGEGKIYLKNKIIIINKNQYVFLKFTDIEKYKSLSNIWGYRWVNFTAKNVRDEFETDKIYCASFCEKNEAAFSELLNYGKSFSRDLNYVNALFLSYYYSVTSKNHIAQDESEGSQSKLIDEMCAFIEQKIYSSITIEEVAAFFNISPRRLHQIFKKELNLSPKQYILKKKMEEGYKILVQTSTPINRIAYMLAFSSPYHFTNVFKKTFGVSPREVRKLG